MAGRKQTATMELTIGATIIAAVIILIVMLMAWGSSTSFLGRYYRVVVNMVNVGGLKEGAPVKMGGFQIGRVSSIRIQQGGTDMEIILDIDEERLLPRRSTAKVSTAGLVGDAFMEIIPGKSTEYIRRAETVADAERIDSSPLPDISELLTKVNEFGDQLTILTANLNDIIGDDSFRRSVKSLATNIDSVSYQANIILQRGQNIVDNVEIASQNIVVLTSTLKDSIEKVTDDIEDVAGKVRGIADQASVAMDKASATIGNLDGGIADARRAINATLGDPDFSANLTAAVKNIQAVTGGLADRRESIDQLLGNLGVLSEDIKGVIGKVREITAAIEVQALANAITSVTTTANSLGGAVEKIMAEPVLVLSINKAADRIVKTKFDEMSRQPQFKSADQQLDEINRWVRDAMNRGYQIDPAYSHDARPYLMNR